MMSSVSITSHKTKVPSGGNRIVNFVKHNDEYMVGVMCFILAAVFVFAIHSLAVGISLAVMGVVVILWDIVDGEEN